MWMEAHGSQIPVTIEVPSILPILYFRNKWGPVAKSTYSYVSTYCTMAEDPSLLLRTPMEAQLSLAPVPRDLMPSSGLKCYQMHIQIKYLDINRFWQKKSNGESKCLPIFVIIPAPAIRVTGKQLEALSFMSSILIFFWESSTLLYKIKLPESSFDILICCILARLQGLT